MTPREKNHALIATIAESFGYTLADVIGPRRQKKLVAVRLVCIQMLRTQGFSTTEIGRIMNRDHSTICHALNKDKAND